MTQRPSFKLIATSIVHAIFGTCGLFFVSALNPIEPWVKSFANESIFIHYKYQLTTYQLAWVWSSISGSLLIGCLVGALLLKPLLNHLGQRDTTMLIKNVFILIGATIQGASKPLLSVELLIFGRLLIGISVTQTLMIPAFMAECCPTEFRGILSSLPIIGTKIWMLLGTVLALPLAGINEQNWNLFLMYPIIPSFIHLLSTPFIPKSPKHLYITEKNEQQANDSILFYHGPQVRVDEVKVSYRLEAEAAKSVKETNMCTILTTNHLRWPLFLCVAAALMFPLSGADIAMLYSTGVIETIGISPEHAPLYTAFFVQLPGVLASFVAIFWLLEKWGRRPLLLLGCSMAVCGCMCLFLATPISSLSNVASNYSIVVGFLLICVGCLGPSVVSYVLAGELAPQASRSTTLSFQAVFDFTVAVIVILGFPPLHQQIGSYAIVPIVILGALVTFFLYCFLPESKGKEVAEIVKIWMKN